MKRTPAISVFCESVRGSNTAAQQHDEKTLPRSQRRQYRFPAPEGSGPGLAS